MNIKEMIITERKVEELIDAGEVIPIGGDYFEDNGGHIVHESDLNSYFEYYLKNLPTEEREEVISRIVQAITKETFKE